MPPFGIFRSEFEIVEGGFAASSNAAAATAIVLVTVAFLGLSVTANRMLLTPRRAGPAAGSATPLARGEPSAWMVVPVVAGVAALLVLGVHPPAELTGLLTRAVHQLGTVT
jgi:hydrogenase-4 component F